VLDQPLAALAEREYQQFDSGQKSRPIVLQAVTGGAS